MDKTYSLADVGAMLNNRNGDNDLIMFILFALIFGNNGAFGANNGALTRAELADGFNFQNVERGIDGLKSGLCDGFYAQNTTMLQGFNSINQNIAESRFASQNCCCETNRNIDAVRYEASRNTCDIVRAIEKDGEATRALINSNTMQALRDKIVEKDQMLQTANFQLSQQAQTANLVQELRPCAKPAYLTCSPYTSTNVNPCGGCGWGPF